MNCSEALGAFGNCLRTVAQALRRRPLTIILVVTVLLYAFLIDRYAQNFGGNMTGFICIGDRFVPPQFNTPPHIVLSDSKGYDGQFFYYMTFDPFITRGMQACLDDPAYRYQRVMYPWLVRLFALGRQDCIPIMMLAVNVIAILIGTTFAGLMLKTQGVSAWYAIFYPLLSGLMIAALRDLAEPTAMAFFMGALHFQMVRRPLPSALFLTAALLAREVLLPAVFVFLFFNLIRRAAWRGAFYYFIPLVLFTAWQAYVYYRIGQAPWRGGGGNFGLPLASCYEHIRFLVGNADRPRAEKVFLILFVPALLSGFLLAIREMVWRPSAASLCFLGFALLPFMMTGSVWVEPWSYARVALPGCVMLFPAMAQSRGRIYLAPFILHAACFIAAVAWVLDW